MSMPIDDYDDLTVEGVKEAVEERSLDYSDLFAIWVYENANKDRVTLLDWIDTRLEKADDDIDQPEKECGGAHPLPCGVDVDCPDTDVGKEIEIEDAEEPEDDEPETIVVTNGKYTGSIAGQMWEKSDDLREVELNRRIERAIDEGLLKRLEPRHAA